MTTVYNLSKSIFGTKTKLTKPSRRALMAMAQPLDDNVGYEMTYDDCNEVNGGSISTTALAAIIDVSLLVVVGAINLGIKAAGWFCKGAAKQYIKKNSPKWAKVLFKTQLVLTFIQSIGGNLSDIVSMFNDVDPIVDKISNMLSIGGLIATIIDNCDGNWDGTCF